MELNFQKEIDKIDNCPANNEIGEKTLFRFIKKPIDKNSFTPHSIIHKPKFNNLCNAWGLSTYDSLRSAKEAFKNLPAKTRLKFDSIAFAKVTDKDGIKYHTKNKVHYTFFPKKNLDLISKFSIVQENES